MQDKTMIIMEPTESDSEKRACLYIERSVLGIVSLLNMFNMDRSREYKLLLIDDDGGVATEIISDNYKLFRLPKNFSLNSDMYAELYDGDELVLTGQHFAENIGINLAKEWLRYNEDGCDKLKFDEQNHNNIIPFDKNTKPLSAKEWAEQSGQSDLFESATQILDKFRDGLYNFSVVKEDESNNYENISNIISADSTLVGNNERTESLEAKTSDGKEEDFSPTLTYWQSIEDDFEELFFLGKREQVLENMFKNSMWTRSLFKGEEMCFGKIYKESSHFYGATPDIVALAIPVLSKKEEKGLLGSFSSYVKLNNVNDGGFMVLLQDAESGRAIKIIKNKGWHKMCDWCKINK